MQGLSDKAVKTQYAENRYKYNGIEYDSTFGLDEYEAFFRDLDPQTGRWWQIDPEADKERESLSPYASMSDDPVFKTDPLGNEDEGCCKGLWDGFMKSVSWINENVNPLNDAVKLVTGRDYNLEGAPQVNRSEAAIGLGLGLLGGKLEGAAAKTLENIVVKDAVKGSEKVAASTAEKVIADGENSSGKARFIVEKDGVTVDTKTTPRGSFQQPGGGRTDVLQDKSHFNKATKENVGQSHTHEPYTHTDPKTGKTYSGADNTNAHRPTYEEVNNIEKKKAKKIN